MALQIERYESERQKYITEKVLWNDEKQGLIRQLEKARQVENFLREQADQSERTSLPKSDVTKMRSSLSKLEGENSRLTTVLSNTKAKLQTSQAETSKLQLEL